jgi:transcriptional regulator with XRE-family HTH domain
MSIPNGRRRRSSPWVGPWLREHRTAAGVALDEIARALDVGRSSVSRLESGVSSIPSDDLPAVLKVYGLTPRRFATRALKAA